MTTSVILDIIFAVLIVGGLAAVCHTAYHVAGGRYDRPLRSFELVEELEEEQLAA